MGRSRWAKLREQVLDTPELRTEYEQAKRSQVITREIIMQLDALRDSSGMSKEELARLAGLDPSSVRRLFTAPDSNPTMRTLLDVMAALDVEIELKPRQRESPPPPSSEKRRGSSSSRRRKPEAA